MTDEPASAADSIEYGAEEKSAATRSDRGPQEQGLTIVDGLMHEMVAPVSIADVDVDVDASNHFLVENTISQFAAHLLRGSFDSRLVRIWRTEDGKREIDIVMTRIGLLAAFTEANLRDCDRVVLIGSAAERPSGSSIRVLVSCER